MQIIFILLMIISAGFSRVLNVPIQYTSIQDGLNEAQPNDTVLVAPGIYNESLQWPEVESIKLIGSSSETTIIDGGNSGSVITIFSDETNIFNSNTVLSGFTLLNGSAQSTYPHDRGGGIFLMNANPTIKDIIIQDCNASYGGGIAAVKSNPILENVTITSNSSQNSGGGLYCDNSSPEIDQSNIIDNTAQTYGGGIYCNDDSSPVIYNCQISGNIAESGGGISSFDGSHPVIENSNITDNLAFRGGGIASFFDSDPIFTTVMITNNSADSTGGGIYIAYGRPKFEDCIISENTAKVGGGLSIGSNDSPEFINTELKNNLASETGGGIYLYEVNPVINNLFIVGNSAQYGGGIYLENSNSELSDLYITENSADYGGGIFFSNSDPVISNSELVQNTAVSGGGLFINYYSNIELNSVNLSYNSANTFGGGIDLEQGSTLRIERSQIHHNTAPIYGGGIYAWNNTQIHLVHVTITDNFSGNGGGITAIAESNGIVVNSIIWNNGESEIYTNNSDVILFYSDIENGWQGEKNLRVDPSFQDNGFDSYFLNIGSRCIDKGTDFFVISNDTLVFHSEDSFDGVSPDMGAIEYFGTIGDLNADGQINMIDLVQIIFILINNEELDNLAHQLADINGDDIITILDVIFLMDMILNT